MEEIWKFGKDWNKNYVFFVVVDENKWMDVLDIFVYIFVCIEY